MKVLSKLKKILGKANGYFTEIEKVIMYISSILLATLTLATVFNRYFLKLPIMPWYEEISVMLYLVLVYWGVSNVAKDDKHMKLTIISEKYKGKSIAMYLGFFSSLVCLCVSIITVYQLIRVSQITTMKSIYLKIPESSIVLIGITMGFFGLTLRYFYRVIIYLNEILNKSKRGVSR